jgi:hypothetical protein
VIFVALVGQIVAPAREDAEQGQGRRCHHEQQRVADLPRRPEPHQRRQDHDIGDQQQRDPTDVRALRRRKIVSIGGEYA